jgi:pyruvate/2-oxoglutarate dehydrogenase complex dihydrolipoamide dehydrogenase (E3) component
LTQAFQRLGSQVTQVEMMPRILPREDEDVAALIAARLREEGVSLHTDATAVEVLTEGGKRLVCEHKDGRREELPFDELIVAVGRRASTDGVDWKELGIELNPNGTIKVDPFLRANGRNIYACGDVIGPYQFTHVASHQAWYCAVNALFSPLKKFKVDYRVVPWVTFTDPEVAQVGLNEQTAKAAGIPYEKTVYGLEDLDRAIAESEDHGQVKVLTVPGKDKILGANIVGHGAGEMLAEFVAAMKHGFGMNKILGTIHAYPTFVEGNKYAAGVWKKAHAPEAVLKYLQRFHGWRR